MDLVGKPFVSGGKLGVGEGLEQIDEGEDYVAQGVAGRITGGLVE